MVPFADALRTVLDHSPRLQPCLKSISDDLTGYVIVEDVYSKEAVPSYIASIVDGYALSHTLQPGIYKVHSNSLAGIRIQPTLPFNQILRITTGAPLPLSADAVVMVEDTILNTTEKGGEHEVEVLKGCKKWENVRGVGSDIAVGQRVLEAGQVVTAFGGEVGVLASIGVVSVGVYRKPIVALFSSGNELVENTTPGPLSYGAIRDCNRPALKQAIQHHGFTVLDLGIVPDDLALLTDAMRKGLEMADVVLTTGGVSMGEKDLLKAVIEREVGGNIHFGRVCLKPGKPTTFATIPMTSKLIFALPGNPVSALVVFQLLVLPSLKKQSGISSPVLATFPVKVSGVV